MWRVTHRSNHRLSFLRRESWYGQVFWSLFLCAGLAGLGVVFLVGIPKMIHHPPGGFWHNFALLIPLVVGGAFTWIGAWGVAGRRGIDIDLSSRRISEWSGYFVPMWRTSTDLAAFQQVVVEPAVWIRGGKTSYWEYPVVLTGSAEKRVEIAVRTPDQAETFAREIAGFLGVKVTSDYR